MSEPTPFQSATFLLMETFKKYAEVEGKKDTLTKAEFKTMLNAEMPFLAQATEAQGKVDQMIKDLDENKDQEIDFMEYMTLVSVMTMCCFELFKE